LFNANGTLWEFARVFNMETNEIIPGSLELFPISISPAMVIKIGFQFALFTGTISYMVLYYRRHIYRTLVNIKRNELNSDIHFKLMKKYERVPISIYLGILVSMTLFAIFIIKLYVQEFQLHWWSILVSICMSLLFIVPAGITKSISNTNLNLDSLSEIIAGLIQPGPISNLSFKVFGSSILRHSLLFISELKLGVYMKIPPKALLISQIYGSIASCIFNYSTFRYLILAFPDIEANACLYSNGVDCNPVMETQWTSPKPGIVYTSSIIWGVVGTILLLNL
jgi:OPT family oligopeptide transporter